MRAENNTEGDKRGTSLIEELFEAGAQYGYSKTRRHPSFQPFIFTTKNGTDIIDLEKTGAEFTKALDAVRTLGKEGGVLLFVGTKPEAQNTVREYAEKAEVPYVTHRWIGGMLTNFPQMQKRIARLKHIEEQKAAGEFGVYTKKEQLDIERERGELDNNFRGIAEMKRLPDMLFVVDPRHEHTAVREALHMNIPVVALVGPDCDISNISYPIPANDATSKSARFFAEKVSGTYSEGKKEGESEKQKEQDERDKAS